MAQNSPPANAARGRTFVLVHGGFHGGWCWSRVAPLLRARGHTVFTPTLTGCGERSHQMSAAITLNTFVDDIALMLTWEDLHDVVLVGHSFGGITITGVADRMPQRLKQLIYLDSLILPSGQSAFDQLDPAIVQSRLLAAQANGSIWIESPPPDFFGVGKPEDLAFLQGRLTPQPMGAYTSSLKLQHPVANGLPAVYVHCTAPLYGGLTRTRDWVKASGMQEVQLATGHDAMVSAPEALTDLLEALAHGGLAPWRPSITGIRLAVDASSAASDAQPCGDSLRGLPFCGVALLDRQPARMVDEFLALVEAQDAVLCAGQ